MKCLASSQAALDASTDVVAVATPKKTSATSESKESSDGGMTMNAGTVFVRRSEMALLRKPIHIV